MLLTLLIIGIPDPDSNAEFDGDSLAGCHLLVSWSCLLLLLSQCQRQGCTDNVLTSNMEMKKNGKTNPV